MNKKVFITGGTGYMGRRLIPLLLAKGFSVAALVRKGSAHKLPAGCTPVVADPFDADSFKDAIPPGCTYIQLLGVPHPGPKKKEQFRTIDLASAKASAVAAQYAGVAHFVYVSVAQTPAKVMQDYQQCRAEAEAFIINDCYKTTFLRPWYVIGPGHYWPLLFLPLFKLLELIPATAQKARALRLVYLRQMLNSLVYAVEDPPAGNLRVLEIADIQQH